MEVCHLLLDVHTPEANLTLSVAPAHAKFLVTRSGWIPAFAGMTSLKSAYFLASQ